ncbi:hypothetical protein ACRJ4W_11820 [Streptomyces sp. GLT-R25]
MARLRPEGSPPARACVLPASHPLVLGGHRLLPEGAAFRIRLAGLLLLPTWFLLFQNFVALLFVPVLAQVAFALWLMPVPLVRFPVKAED